jgi:hypothetical protein
MELIFAIDRKWLSIAVGKLSRSEALGGVG